MRYDKHENCAYCVTQKELVIFSFMDGLQMNRTNNLYTFITHNGELFYRLSL